MIKKIIDQARGRQKALLRARTKAMLPPRFMAIEGPIGAGKTSLAKRLAADFGAELVLEQAETNPFLPRFYEDRAHYALATQIAFLTSRYEQQRALLQREAPSPPVVADYSFNKDWIFARLNLDDDELRLYQRLYTQLIERLPRPDLVIYLESGSSLLKKHVKRRNQPYERHITIEYLEEVLEAYKSFFFSYNETPLLVVNCSEIDFVNSETDYQNLLKEIVSDKRGTKHYVTIGS